MTAIEPIFDENRDLTLERVIDATPQAVFDAWIDPAKLPQWWGPHGMTTPVCEIDARPGGLFRTVMRAPDGAEYPTQGVFLLLAPGRRLVFTDAFDPDWRPSAKPFFTADVRFEDLDGKTRLTAFARHWTVEDRETHERMGFANGWAQTLERLDACVSQQSRAA